MRLKHKIITPINEDFSREVVRLFTARSFDERKCAPCENRPQRFNDLCAVCPGYKGSVCTADLWRDRSTGHMMAALPMGRLELLQQIGIPLEAAQDERPVIPFRYDLRFTGTLRDGSTPGHADQRAAVDAFVARGLSGFLLSPPRSGKTVMGTALVCRYRCRTVIMAAQVDWLRQFLRTFYDMTNLKDLEAQGHRPVMLIEKGSDWAAAGNSDVVLSTYQMFLRDPNFSKLAEYLYSKFTIAVIDEADQTAPEGYSEVIGNLDVKLKIGLSATYARKDGLEQAVTDIIGPPRVTVDLESMTPHVLVVPTGIKFRQTDFTNLVTAVATHPERNERLLRYAMEIVNRDPSRYVLITVARLEQANVIIRCFKAMKLLAQQRGEMLDEDLVTDFTGSTPNRDKRLAAIQAGKHKIVVGMMKVVKRGIDVSHWTDLIISTPIASKISPDPEFVQLSARVRSLKAGKSQPVVHLVHDDSNISKGCIISTWFKSVQHMGLFYSEETLAYVRGLAAEQRKKRNAQGALSTPDAPSQPDLFDWS